MLVDKLTASPTQEANQDPALCRLDFTPSSRYMMVGGHKGHLAIVDMKQMSLIKEFQGDSSCMMRRCLLQPGKSIKPFSVIHYWPEVDIIKVSVLLTGCPSNSHG
ncbi:putative transcription factor WD40-like family [Rosa chinensis]|uniref:Putative transcription factor WD40-like family n=1 Tax=Rosa chinensis TaxID=74649 RepID=A0A2P6SCR9_ROSCH|nr:putative transcription factor WD40-like family [Rosa chinensis]